ncbi:uroporphyrin-III C-methyltransferase / precorrin-2 dehydrogenase / sirohydrochlorin ferrochelatase [Tranquillimonas rosea]|uniref:Uroporphyrin-III C-methyltransferase / precorrin-2 dehydrogenase / sirohydrochlorin ferrochelatase n=1 Tax=Tranquillimonas rosea TaxID=641238 RepID=A0A1H9V5U2_9RHOB|nr:siroheme synthase CysG [Tranquillimonas rosea]SES17116.1 uroporphyrin-III C-methyltransferase / precorrin-2 dehydrogenase / sirohydrochlorin ferrochelatase [Tranquillimonas rosea]
MKHFPIFLAVEGRRIVLSGGGDAALAKLRLLMKTEGRITVFAADPVPEIEGWADQGKLRLVRRAAEPGDALCAALFYAANDDDAEDARVAALARADGALVNWVDNLGESEFITPAIVDRDPVTVAIGTEGAAPVVARKIKKDLEESLPSALGLLARIGKAFRPMVEALPMGRKRRDFWSEYYFDKGPRAVAENGADGAQEALDGLLASYKAKNGRDTHVSFVGAGPGDPELLTLKARNALHEADVVIHDRLVPAGVLELARREATIIEAGKTGFGPSMTQEDINALIVRHATDGAQVVRLKSGDPTVYGRLDEEIEACDGAGLRWSIVPGITAASAAVAGIGQSLTKRDRNSSLRILTGHDMKGFAEHDWRALARPGEIAAIYMGKKSARFIQGRMLMHGADPETPVTVIENASRADQRILSTRLSQLEPALRDAAMTGPALMLYGLAPRAALAAIDDTALQEAVQ